MTVRSIAGEGESTDFAVSPDMEKWQKVAVFNAASATGFCEDWDKQAQHGIVKFASKNGVENDGRGR